MDIFSRSTTMYNDQVLKVSVKWIAIEVVVPSPFKKGNSVEKHRFIDLQYKQVKNT